MFSIGLKKGDLLEFARGSSITATVESDSTVMFDGEELSLTKSALKAIHSCGYAWTVIAGPTYWMYQGESLKEREERLNEELQ